MELFDPEVLNQVCYGLKDIPYDLSICNHMPYLVGDNEKEKHLILANMMTGEKTLMFSMLLCKMLEQDEHRPVAYWCLDSQTLLSAIVKNSKIKCHSFFNHLLWFLLILRFGGNKFEPVRTVHMFQNNGPIRVVHVL